MPLILLLCLVVTSAAYAVLAQEAQQPPSCQEQLMTAKAMAGNYQNDYLRKVNELTNAQVQAAKSLQRVQFLEKELAALKKPEEPKK